jgi:hypothetical protein
VLDKESNVATIAEVVGDRCRTWRIYSRLPIMTACNVAIGVTAIAGSCSCSEVRRMNAAQQSVAADGAPRRR